MSSGLLRITIAQVIERLSDLRSGHYAIIGLDGFVDKIQKAVESQDQSGSTYYTCLENFGQRILDAAGQSAQVELHTNTVKLGGNAPIFGNALACLGIKNTCLGTFGYPQIHPVFQKIHNDCDLVSLGDAAETNALEFDDGKLILSELSTFQGLDWSQVKRQLDLDELIRKSSTCNLIGLVDWCNLLHATDIWTGFLQDIIRPHVRGKPHFFFDLADPTKKSVVEVKKVISIINQFSDYGSVTLGLNVNETMKIGHFLGLHVENNDEHACLKQLGRALFDQMSIGQLLIHPIDGCFLFNEQDLYYLEGRVVRHPTVSTGGGDNFNAGFCFGQLNGFSTEETMVLAMATSGAYVQNGSSPDVEKLNSYLKNWKEEL